MKKPGIHTPKRALALKTWEIAEIYRSSCTPSIRRIFKTHHFFRRSFLPPIVSSADRFFRRSFPSPDVVTFVDRIRKGQKRSNISRFVPKIAQGSNRLETFDFEESRYT
jgi:hypothetical protein